jgi:hypothetical protein
MHTSDSTLSFASSTTISSVPQDDIYDKFIDLYISSDIKERFALIKTINNKINHPAYSHLLKTMDYTNVHYIMGYLRSQHFGEMYTIIEQILS